MAEVRLSMKSGSDSNGPTVSDILPVRLVEI